MLLCFSFFFFFNDTATTEIYTLSLHDALPISRKRARSSSAPPWRPKDSARCASVLILREAKCSWTSSVASNIVRCTRAWRLFPADEHAATEGQDRCEDRKSVV